MISERVRIRRLTGSGRETLLCQDNTIQPHGDRDIASKGVLGGGGGGFKHFLISWGPSRRAVCRPVPALAGIFDDGGALLWLVDADGPLSGPPRDLSKGLYEITASSSCCMLPEPLFCGNNVGHS